jgi:organic radical activating enzyme
MKCAWVENMLSIETDGFSRACCLETNASARIAPISDGILNSFDHPRLIELKQNLENGFSEKTRPFCSRCEKLENQGQSSLRTTTTFISYKRELKYLQFKLSNKCQLACLHCGPTQSSTWAKKININPPVKNSLTLTDEFINELKNILPNLIAIKFTGGEPFLDSTHWQILEHLKTVDRSHCEIHYITNGVSNFKEHLWEGWKKIKCSVSVDGFEETYEWFRRKAKWSHLIQNIEKLKAFSDVGINFSITPFTIQDWHKANDFWKDEIYPIPIVHPRHASLIDFPRSIIEKINNFETIPYINLATGNNLNLYKNWAEKWDQMWNTPGWSKKIFWWVK